MSVFFFYSFSSKSPLDTYFILIYLKFYLRKKKFLNNNIYIYFKRNLKKKNN